MECVNDACVDPQDGSGQYSNILDCKDVCYPPSWNCINNACVDPQDGSGLYTTLADCEYICTTTAIQSIFKQTDKKVKRIVEYSWTRNQVSVQYAHLYSIRRRDRGKSHFHRVSNTNSYSTKKSPIEGSFFLLFSF